MKPQELLTSHPDFYTETQRIFLSLFKKGLAYQDEAKVNWDPIDRTVLANEQVDSNGFSWRSGAKVEQRRLKQWFVRITDYAESLLDGLKQLEKDNRWPPHVVAMQRNWLGRSEGTKLRFKLDFTNQSRPTNLPEYVDVFTTRADTLFGAQYIALAVDHPIVKDLAGEDPELQSAIDRMDNQDADSKAGVQLPLVRARNPLATILEDAANLHDLPVFAAPYVRSDYGSGAVMGVPAHDSRDFEFWKQNTEQIPRFVIEPEDALQHVPAKDHAVVAKGTLSDQCYVYSGLHSQDAIKQITSDLATKDVNLARTAVNWRLRDWLISRQRYWGCPIPIIHCPACGAVPVPEESLPVTLPALKDEQWKGLRGNPLEHDEDWCSVSCPQCGSAARRETDTMDTFVDSSWYYIRFAQNDVSQHLMPVDLYIGGVEHAILHLLYARFIYKFLSNENGAGLGAAEPFRRLLTQGMVHGKTFSDPDTGRFLKPIEVDGSVSGSIKIRSTGKQPNVSYEKMSKSKHNGVDPLQCMQTYGTDVTRAHLLFQAPPTEVLEWDEEKIVGIQRWFGRVWGLVQECAESGAKLSRSMPHPQTPAEVKLWKTVQSTVASVNESLSDTLTLNTVISDLMTLTNTVHHIQKNGNEPECRDAVVHESLRTLLKMMVPVAPSFAEECWAVLNHHETHKGFAVDDTASFAGFPQTDGSLAKMQEQTQTCAVQVNGKVKFTMSIPTPPQDLCQPELQDWILAQLLQSTDWSRVASKFRINVNTAKKIIVVRGGRTVNIVP